MMMSFFCTCNQNLRKEIGQFTSISVDSFEFGYLESHLEFSIDVLLGFLFYEDTVFTRL